MLTLFLQHLHSVESCGQGILGAKVVRVTSSYATKTSGDGHVGHPFFGLWAKLPRRQVCYDIQGELDYCG